MADNQPTPIAVFGGRGGGAMVAMTIEAAAAAGEPVRFIGYLNDEARPGERVHDAPVLGPFASWSDLDPATRFVYPLHKWEGMRARLDLFESLQVPDDRLATVVDPRAIVAADARFGPGTVVGPAAWVGAGVVVGRLTAIRHRAHVGHDSTVGDFSFLSVDSFIAGYVKVGSCVHLAPGALVREHLSLGSDSVIGMGAVVLSDVPDGSTVVGNPARNLSG